MQLTEKIEKELIEQIKLGNDEALRQLCCYYQPLINNLERQYFIRSYDRQDWQQDAMIICYETALNYDSARGKFGSYFKTRLTNHIKTLLRYEMAYRRRALAQSISLEAAVESGLSSLHQPLTQAIEIPLSEKFAELLTQLSDLEIKALLIILGKWSQEEALKKLKIEQITLIRARSRLMQKMRQALL
ncbi:sigma-70 family RNA polymerase sigma factor [Lactobacillus sp. ESL0785]|uniref:sigma-70 family RNA polymerase sigma factor n=1 Tax=Lactobacillus sp. ESL0785 TaxID=2983232 RepID=UPI0023FA31E2|nr:sigma-70 family RNA polymerase sigma factor [Lactobacillus sp. ESL0785]WEV70524.1 sigma-70 family RNA polymerase sigma factor [Lactobacillus sp. ESL0785]